MLDESDDLLRGFAFAVERGEKLGLRVVVRRIGKKQRDRETDIAAVQVDAATEFLDERFHAAAVSISRNQWR